MLVQVYCSSAGPVPGLSPEKGPAPSLGPGVGTGLGHPACLDPGPDPESVVCVCVTCCGLCELSVCRRAVSRLSNQYRL